MAVDHLVAYCAPFLAVTISSFVFVVWWQFRRLDNEINRLIILNTRLALFLPLYGILIYVSLAVPVLYLAFEVPIALIEGYSFYLFFVLMVTNLGGPTETVNYLNASNKPLFFHCCCPTTKRKFYRQATWNLFHIVVTRVCVIFLSVICSYFAKKYRLAKLLSVLFSLIALIQLIYGLAAVVNLYDDVYGYLKNISGVLKALLLKKSVGFITLQSIVVNFLVQFGGNPYKENSQYSAEDRLQRYNCALLLAEFTLLAGLYLYSFTREITLPSTPYKKYILQEKGGIGCKIKPSLGWFLCEVFSFSDVFGVLAIDRETDDPAGTELVTA